MNGIDERWKTPSETLREMVGTCMDKGLFAEAMACGHLVHQVEAYMTGASTLWLPTGTAYIWRIRGEAVTWHNPYYSHTMTYEDTRKGEAVEVDSRVE